jgi:HD-GYP domain-containing protein (c-di-GMP phosphodiesterase class II)
LLIFAILRLMPRYDIALSSHLWHFLIVSLVAAVALGLALAVTMAARNLPDSRTYFLAMAFVTMAGIFLAHGLGTAPFLGGSTAQPSASSGYDSDDYGYGYDSSASQSTTNSDHGAHEEAGEYGSSSTVDARLAVVGLSARLSILLSALFFVLAVTNLGPRASQLVLRCWSALTLAVLSLIVIYDVVALAAPRLLAWIPITSPGLSWSVAALAWVALAFAGWRFLQACRLSYLPLQGTMALSMALLAEAQLFMILGPTWHLSWWEYHVVMLAGFLAPVLGMLSQYRTTGDLAAIIEGLFLRQSVTGIRAGDPQALNALGAAVAAKDGETSSHVDRVSQLATAIGERLGLEESRIDVLRWAGRLHDLGKIGVPTSILLKPGPLTDAEYRLMKMHSARGWEVARRCGILSRAAPAIRGHHERWNGSGYPDGLAGEAIPLEARIIAAADVWDALTAERPYRPAWTPDDATAMIRSDSGVLLDPQCVDALFDVLAQRAQPVAIG